MSETFEQAIERCLMDGTTAKALRLIAADFDDESNGFIEIAALQQGADGLDTLVARVADLTASLNRASDACASVQRERDEAVIVLRRLVQSVDELISESAGVYGLHLNGDPAPWEELTVAGKYEEWLIELECSRAFLSRYEGEVK